MLNILGRVHLVPHLIEMFTVFCTIGSHSFFYCRDIDILYVVKYL